MTGRVENIRTARFILYRPYESTDQSVTCLSRSFRVRSVRVRIPTCSAMVGARHNIIHFMRNLATVSMPSLKLTNDQLVLASEVCKCPNTGVFRNCAGRPAQLAGLHFSGSGSRGTTSPLSSKRAPSSCSNFSTVGSSFRMDSGNGSNNTFSPCDGCCQGRLVNFFENRDVWIKPLCLRF